MRSTLCSLLSLCLVTACSDDDTNTTADAPTDTASGDVTTTADTTTTTAATDTTVTETTEAADTATADAATSCVDRECGPDPVTHASCGTCAAPGLLACNDGTCEATCDDTKCAAMDYTENTCVSSGECDGSPDGGIASATHTCNQAGTICEVALAAVDCGLSVTTCMPCDLAGTDDGVCQSDACVAPAATDCKPATCGARECGPDPVTHRSCGDCETPGLLACNDGVCEALCDDTKCAAMGYDESTCVSTGECDGSPAGAISNFTFACNAADTLCELSASAVDCGLTVTDCMACDLAGTDDGRCEDDVCKAAAETTCE